MSQLSLFLFGPPRIERDREVVTTDTRKAVALIAYLAITRQRHSRDALAALLWPDYDQPHARATLRRTLSALNKVLAGNWLSIDRETVGLDQVADFWLDVDEFRNHLAECRTHNHSASETCPACLGPLTAAAKLYCDDFMAGFSLHDSSTFDDWQFYQADNLRREFAGTLERLVACHSAQADFESALSYARRWLAIDRLHEPAHRQLMQLYAWTGQRGAAIHQYQECRQILEEELGVAPLEATTQLYKAIKNNQGPPPPRPQPATPAHNTYSAASTNLPTGPQTDSTPGSSGQSSPVSYPLLGRLIEWSSILATYRDIDTDGRAIILEGEAGIGKTRLAEEFLAYSGKRGAVIIAARCYEGEAGLAYGPIVTGLRAAIAQKREHHWLEGVPAHWLSEAARLLPELATLCPGLPPAPPLDSPGAQSRFFEGIRQVILAVCNSGSDAGVVFFDDVHWADAASLDLLSYMVRRLREQPLCMLLTWRTSQVNNVHRLHHLLTEAQHAGKAIDLSLPRLSRETVKELAQSIAPGGIKLPQGLIERLYRETEGLPLFLIEYLTAMTNGVLTTEDDDWSLPGGVRDLLISRLEAVGEASTQLLSTAAVIGRSFDFDALREVSGRSEEETVSALEVLINQGLVVEMRGNVEQASGEIEPVNTQPLGAGVLIYDFSHEKLRSLVYEMTSQARRRLLHRRVAELIITRMRGHRRGGALAGRVAYHYQMAGNQQAAAEYYLQAGEYARSLYAYNEALAHFRSALALKHPQVEHIHEAIGDLHTFQGEYAAAIKSYQTAAATLHGSTALATIDHKLGRVYERRGNWEQAEQHYAAALHTLGDTGAAGERSRIYADWSLAAYHRHQIEQALDLAQRALDLAEVANDTHALAQAYNVLGILATSQKELEQAQIHLEKSLALTEQLNDASIRTAALNNLAQVCKANGAIERAIQLTESALALSASQGDRHREAALHNNLADQLYATGKIEDAMLHLKQAVSIYAEIGVEAGTLQPEIWKLAEW